jgi:septal ring factor EnvC (AmiA/AmiB activator)
LDTLKAKTEQLAQLEQQCSDLQKNVLNLQSEQKDLERLTEKMRQEASQTFKAHQQEISRNREYSAKIASLEESLRYACSSNRCSLL